MFDINGVLPMLVAFRTWPWIKIAAHSFREHFQERPLLIVDNNPATEHPDWCERCNDEHKWLREQPWLIIINNPGPDYSAGKGLDLGIGYARENGFSAIVHLEPDCLIRGNQWWDGLLKPLRNGAWMSGQLRRFYGPIHPTPSAWRTDISWKSFAAGPREDDDQHPLFQTLFEYHTLMQWAETHEPHAIDWWKDTWDTAQRNWFYAAIHDAAVLVEDPGDFVHFWYGSQRSPDPTDPRLKPYLEIE